MLRRAAGLPVPPLVGGPAGRGRGHGQRGHERGGPGRTVRGLPIPRREAGDAVRSEVEATKGKDDQKALEVL